MAIGCRPNCIDNYDSVVKYGDRLTPMQPHAHAVHRYSGVALRCGKPCISYTPEALLLGILTCRLIATVVFTFLV